MPSDTIFNTLFLSIVIPIYNEEEFLEPLLNRLKRELQEYAELSYEIILVENGSKDRTREVGNRLVQECEGAIRLLQVPEANYGLALREGLRSAGGEAIVNFDLDFWDLEFVSRALKMLSTFDIIIASKSLPESSDERPWLRRVITRGFQVLLFTFFRLRVSDTHGIKLWKRAAILPFLEQTQSNHDLFDTELIIRCIQGNLNVCELPVRVRALRPSRTSILRRSMRTMLGLLRLRCSL